MGSGFEAAGEGLGGLEGFCFYVATKARRHDVQDAFLRVFVSSWQNLLRVFVSSWQNEANGIAI